MIFLQIFDWTKRTLTPQHPSSDPAILKRTTLSNVDEWKRNMEPTCKCSMRSANLVGRANLGHLVSRITAFLEWVTIVNQFHRTIYTTSCHHWWHCDQPREYVSSPFFYRYVSKEETHAPLRFSRSVLFRWFHRSLHTVLPVVNNACYLMVCRHLLVVASPTRIRITPFCTV